MHGNASAVKGLAMGDRCSLKPTSAGERERRQKKNTRVLADDKDFLNDQKDPDLVKLIIGIKRILVSLKPNLIIVDQYYSGNDIYNGLNVVEKLREISKFKNCPIFLISGKRDKIVRDIFTNTDFTIPQKVNSLSKIINYKIDKFLDKNFYLHLQTDKDFFMPKSFSLSSVKNK